MLMKLTKGLNFIDILSAAFLSKRVLRIFMCLHFDLVTFLGKNIGKKAAHVMLAILTKGVIFPNILQTTFFT